MSIAELPPPTQTRETRTQHDEIKTPPMPANLRQILKPYREASAWRASWQIANTMLPFFLAWAAAWISVDYSYALTLACSVLISALMVRIFTLHHDCTHGSFFKTRAANEFWGFWLGLFTLTPFHRWRRSHNYHHAHSGDLDHRGEGYITMHTIKEYLALTPAQQLWYRVYRSPLMMFLIGPFIQFVILERFTFDLPKTAKVARWGVWKTNLAMLTILAAIFAVGSLTGFGGWAALGRFAMIFVPVSLLGAALGVWLFFVQHNYEEAYFKRHREWNYATAALEGSSFYDLPQVLHWFSANIGFHHIHHLDATIPNYNLQRCMREHPEFQAPVTIGLFESVRCIGLDLWDEENGKLVPMSAAKKVRRTSARS
jgi:omega-6 fatty acid desaturase (delta-12 desaturase)